MENLKKNLANIEHVTDLFGNVAPKLSMRDRIGFLPISIWQPNWQITKELKKLVGDDGSTRQLVGDKMALPGSTVQASIFNPHLAQMILSAYCPPSAEIYDPFGGGGTRGFIAALMGHKYTGVELRTEEVERIRQRQIQLNTYFKIEVGDATQYYTGDNAFDFSYTCPPYYDLEVYSHDPKDLSNASSYETFLSMLQQALANTYAMLKPNALSIWVVGNFRNRHGELIHFSGDCIRRALAVGFKLHDELVFWGASNAAVQRVGQFEAHRRSVRVHEFILIFKKDGTQEND